MDTLMADRLPRMNKPASQAGRRETDRVPAAGAELLDFARTLCAASSRQQLSRRFADGFSRLFDLPMYGLYIVDPWTGAKRCVASAGVSDSFLARYERGGRELDWLGPHVDTTGHAVYNLALMSMDEWLENPLYTKLKYLHDIRHEVQAPVVNGDGVIGMLHCGTNDPRRGFTPYEVRLTEALGGVVGAAIEGIDHRGNLARERDQAVVALERTGTAVVITDTTASEPRLNNTARRLLAEVVDAEYAMHQVLARLGTAVGFARHVDVELVDGGTGLLYGQSSYARAVDGTLVTVLELQRDRSEIGAATLAALTPREREIALLVVDGLTDREVAQRLFLSHHTVSQYVKRIYRKLDVSSRVALTRRLLGPRDSRHRRSRS
jgi:DNA-binding CsgD family transcriptional regulator